MSIYIHSHSFISLTVFIRSALEHDILSGGNQEGPVQDPPGPDTPHDPKLCPTCLVDRSKATMHCSVHTEEIVLILFYFDLY